MLVKYMTTVVERISRKERARLKVAQLEVPGRPLIGREVCVVPQRLTAHQLAHFDRFATRIDGHRARAIDSKMCTNSTVSWVDLLGDGRPASAYFTLLRGRLIIEWGEIGIDGSSKLHDYINRTIDYERRIVEYGAVVRSGHIATLNLGGETVRVALVDSIDGYNGPATVTPDRPEYLILKGLISRGVLPVGGGGWPVVLSSF